MRPASCSGRRILTVRFEDRCNRRARKESYHSERSEESQRNNLAPIPTGLRSSTDIQPAFLALPFIVFGRRLFYVRQCRRTDYGEFTPSFAPARRSPLITHHCPFNLRFRD